MKQAGLRCVVVEAREVGGGITRNTTAKITAQHGLIYADLLERFGHEKAQQYYNANTQAIEWFAVLAGQIPCDFERQTAYVYSLPLPPSPSCPHLTPCPTRLFGLLLSQNSATAQHYWNPIKATFPGKVLEKC